MVIFTVAIIFVHLPTFNKLTFEATGNNIYFDMFDPPLLVIEEIRKGKRVTI